MRDKDPNSTIQCIDENKTTMDTGELINYLINCYSRQLILDFFKRVTLDQTWYSSDKAATIADRDTKVKVLQEARSVKIDNIVIDDDLFKIWALLGKDPEMYLAFMKSVITYRGWDLDEKDLFRNPIDTMQTGWADCDDWAVVHYFWAHLHRFNPNLVIAVRPDSTGKVVGTVDTVNAHTFATYINPANGNLVVLDNQSFTELKPNETLEGYIASNYPGKDLAIAFNAPFTG